MGAFRLLFQWFSLCLWGMYVVAFSILQDAYAIFGVYFLVLVSCFYYYCCRTNDINELGRFCASGNLLTFCASKISDACLFSCCVFQCYYRVLVLLLVFSFSGLIFTSCPFSLLVVLYFLGASSGCTSSNGSILSIFFYRL